MHSVCETFPFQAAAKEAGMTRGEIDAFVDMIAAEPTAGDVMVGTGGCRKIRFAKPGHGKSGGYRVVTYFGGARLPVFLLTVFGKGEKTNLTKAERNGLANLTKILADTYQTGAVAGARR